MRCRNPGNLLQLDRLANPFEIECFELMLSILLPPLERDRRLSSHLNVDFDHINKLAHLLDLALIFFY